MRVEPISCLRPVPERAGGFAAPPYDVFDDEQARSYVAAHPRSFLDVDRPETAFGPEQDPYAPEVYAHAAEVVRERVADGTLVTDDEPCFYAYRLMQGGHAQVGIMGAASVDEYLEGTICRHEQVREEKVADRVAHIEALGAQTGPVLLAYRDDAAIDALVASALEEQPLYDFTDDDGLRHSFWRIAQTEALEAAFEKVGRAYIADGHHRAAASVRICEELRAAGVRPGRAESFLAIIYPASSMQVLAYNRVVADTRGLDEAGLLSALAAQGVDVEKGRAEASEPPRQGQVGMYAFGSWYQLSFRDVPGPDAGARERLDVVLLQDRVLDTILGIEDPTTDARISFVSGAEGTAELERLAGSAGVAFAMYPTSVDELMAVSDAGQLMPPKSTWFAPKPASGLVLRPYRPAEAR